MSLIEDTAREHVLELLQLSDLIDLQGSRERAFQRVVDNPEVMSRSEVTGINFRIARHPFRM